MIVECPRCRARYRVESGLLERDQTFKCSRCSHVFAYEAESTSDAPEADPPPALTSAPAAETPRVEARRHEPRQDSMSFSFSGSDTASGETEESEPAPQRFAPPPPVPASRPPDRDFSFRGEEEPEEPESDYGGPHEIVRDEPRFVRGEDELRVEDQSAGSAGRPYFVYLAVLVVLYAILALDLSNHPAQSEKLLASVPIVGSVLAEDHLLQTRVQLQDVEGTYQQIKDERMVFIVSGRAINTSSEPLKGVQIESAVYDAGGKPIETKSIYCGNAMSLKIVKDLSTKEISLLQRLEPPKRFEIRPGESAGFSVVFLNPPRTLREFTARVAAAQASS